MIEVCHNMKCEDWGWALLPPFLLSPVREHERDEVTQRKDDFEETTGRGKLLLKSPKTRTFTTPS
jgi:hypothetical protein